MPLNMGGSAASKAYVGGSAASKLYIGSSLIADFSGGGGPTEKTVFGASAPSGALVTPVTTYNDLGANGWTGSNFYLAANPGGTVRLVGGRLWVPTGSGMIGLAAKMGYYRQASRIARNMSPADIISAYSVAGNQVTKAALAQGWNEFRLPTPLTLTWSEGLAIGFQVGTGTWYVAGPSGSGDKAAVVGNGISLQEENATYSRGEYWSGGAGWAYQGAWYGADIILSW